MPHPNTVKVIAKTNRLGTWNIVGVSIGGGKMVIESINDIDVQYTGDYNTLVTHHRDSTGMLARIASILSENRINIANTKLYRKEKNKRAIGIIEADEVIDRKVLDDLLNIDGMIDVTYIDKIYR